MGVGRGGWGGVEINWSGLNTSRATFNRKAPIPYTVVNFNL